MARIFTAEELSPISDNAGAIHKASDLAPMDMRDSLAPEKPELTIGQKIGKAAEYLPTAGAVVGGGLSMLAAPGTAGASLLGGSALAGLGAAAGKAGEQVVKRMVGEEAPESSTEAAGQIFKEGALTTALNAAGGKIMATLAPTAKIAAKQLLKAFARIDERITLKVLNDPTILTRAKPLSEAKQIFSDFFENNGFTYGPKAVKAATGKLSLSDNAADDFVSDTIEKIGVLERIPQEKEYTKTVVQEALAARYSLKDAINRAVRTGNDSKAKMFIEARVKVDDWLENQVPGFAKVRKVYEEAKIRKAFEPIFPLNKNKETSVLGVLTSLGSAVGAGGAFGPAAAIPAAVVSSPRVAGMAIKAGGKIAEVAKPLSAATSEIVSNKILDNETVKK